jgi:hypothetical protein
MPHGLELSALSLMALKTLNLHLQPFISSMYRGEASARRADPGGQARLPPVYR